MMARLINYQGRVRRSGRHYPHLANFANKVVVVSQTVFRSVIELCGVGEISFVLVDTASNDATAPSLVTSK